MHEAWLAAWHQRGCPQAPRLSLHWVGSRAPNQPSRSNCVFCPCAHRRSFQKSKCILLFRITPSEECPRPSYSLFLLTHSLIPSLLPALGLVLFLFLLTPPRKDCIPLSVANSVMLSAPRIGEKILIFSGIYRNIWKKSSGPQFCHPLQASSSQERLARLRVNVKGVQLLSACSLLLLFHPRHPLGQQSERELPVHALLSSDEPSGREGWGPRMGRLGVHAWADSQALDSAWALPLLFFCVSPFCFAKPAGCTWTSLFLCSPTLPGQKPAWHDPCNGVCALR